MGKQQRTGKGGLRKIGRALEKCKRYKAANTRERNKAKRVLQSNGLDACLLYCQAHGVKMPKSRKED